MWLTKKDGTPMSRGAGVETEGRARQRNEGY